MADPIVVLVFLASAGSPDPIGSAMTQAARTALGHDAIVRVEEKPELPTPDEAQRLGDQDHATAVVEVDWRDPEHTHATLRVHEAHRTTWATREVSFLPADPPDERGRTLGFAMASLIEGGDERATVAPTLSPARAEAPPDRAAFSRVMIDAAGIGTLGGAGATAAGAEVSGFALFHPRLAGVATANVQLGDIASAQSTFTSVQVGGGAAWRALLLPVPPALEVDLRADVLATFLHAAHQGQTESTWQPGARAAVEAAWFPFIPSLGLVALAGGEARFGTASVVIGNRTAATVSPFRAVAELGLRARF